MIEDYNNMPPFPSEPPAEMREYIGDLYLYVYL